MPRLWAHCGYPKCKVSVTRLRPYNSMQPIASRPVDDGPANVLPGLPFSLPSNSAPCPFRQTVAFYLPIVARDVYIERGG